MSDNIAYGDKNTCHPEPDSTLSDERCERVNGPCYRDVYDQCCIHIERISVRPAALEHHFVKQAWECPDDSIFLKLVQKEGNQAHPHYLSICGNFLPGQCEKNRDQNRAYSGKVEPMSAQKIHSLLPRFYCQPRPRDECETGKPFKAAGSLIPIVTRQYEQSSKA